MYKMRKYKKMSYGPLNIYLKPDFLYIPLICMDDTNITVLVKKGDYVYKGSMIGRKKDEVKLGIFSSVSGTVVDFVEKYYYNGIKIKCVQIRNDYKENYEKKCHERKDLSVPFDTFVDILKNHGIVDMLSGKPVYTDFCVDKRYKNLVINAVEPEPYITCSDSLIRLHAEEILEMIDAMITINGLESSFIVIKNTDAAVRESLNNYIGTYNRIKIIEVEPEFANGLDDCILDVINMHDDVLLTNPLTVYEIYEAVKYGAYASQRIVTFSGENFKNPQNVLVKNGTNVKEVIDFIGGYKRDKNIYLVAGGAMKGFSLPDDDIVVSLNLNGILALKFKPIISNPCIKCGKCIDICPKHLNPVLIMNSINNPKVLEKLNVHDCNECGLCSYICPSRILVRDSIIIAKEKRQK